MSNKENVIQVVLAVYDPAGTYSRYAGVVITSLFSNTRSRVNVTILHDATLTADNKCRFERTAERWNQSVSFIDVSEHIFRIAEDPDNISPLLSRGTLFRLLIQDLMNVPKVIYLDCDIVVNLDITDLWNVPLETQNASLAVVKDPCFPNLFRKRYRKIRAWAIPYVPEKYFNAGVLLMDLQKIRKKYNLIQDAFEFFNRYIHVAHLADNDFLNVFFHDDILFLEKRFNYTINCDSIDNAILHFAGYQPWKTPRNTPRDRLFWKIFMESEWRDQFEGSLVDMFQNKSLECYHSLDCVKLLLRRIPRHLLLCDFFEDLRIIFKELYWRMTRKNFAQLDKKERG